MPRLRSSISLWVLLLSIAGCDETSVVLVIHSNDLRIPQEMDALCLQLAAGGQFLFGQRYPLRADEAGAARTLSVLPGERSSTGFEILLRGERRGWEVTWNRESAAFQEHVVQRRHLYLKACGTRQGQGRFSWKQQLTDSAGSVVAGVPVAMAPSVVVAVSPGDGRRFAYIQDGIKQLPGGLPPVGSGAVRDLIATDLDGDCDLDLLLLQEDGPHVWRHGEDGTFQEQAGAILLTGDYHNAAAADFDLDGFVDLVLASPTEVKLLLNNGQGTGTFRDESALLPTGLDAASDVAVGFINRGTDPARDYYPDIVVAREGEASSPQPSKVLVNRFSDGKLSFDSVTLTDTRRTRSVAVADFDGDGLHDVVFGHVSDLPLVYLNRSTATAIKLEVRAKALINVSADTVERILAEDLDDDCDTDIVLASSVSTVVYLNDGQGAFVESQGGPHPGSTRAAAIDMDGDAALDLVLGGEQPGAAWLTQEKLD